MAASREWLDRAIMFSLCLLIFALPFSKSAVEACVAAAFILWVLKRAVSYEPRALSIRAFEPVPTLINIPLYLFVLAGFLSVLVSGSVFLSLRGFFSKLLPEVFLFFIIAEVVDNRKRVDLILAVMILSMLLIGADAIFQCFTGNDFLRNQHIPGWENVYRDIIARSRPSASFNGPNSLGGWLVVMIPVALSAAAIDKKQLSGIIIKSTIWISAIISILCLVMTRSVGAWLGFIFAVFLFFICKKNKIFLVAAALILTVILFGSIYLMCANINLPGIKNCIVQIMLKEDVVRTNLWKEALRIIGDFPIFGCGLNTYSIIAPGYKTAMSQSGIYPHNSYLQMAAETGILGLASFLLVIGSLFSRSLLKMNNIADAFYKSVLLGLLAGLFGFLIHSFFDVNFYALQLVNLMWFIMGLIIAVQKIAAKEQSA